MDSVTPIMIIDDFQQHFPIGDKDTIHKRAIFKHVAKIHIFTAIHRDTKQKNND